MEEFDILRTISQLVIINEWNGGNSVKRKKLLLLSSTIVLIITSVIILLIFTLSAGLKTHVTLEEGLDLRADEVEKIIIRTTHDFDHAESSYAESSYAESSDPAVIRDIFQKLSFQDYTPQPKKQPLIGGTEYWITFFPKDSSAKPVSEKGGPYSCLTYDGYFIHYCESEQDFSDFAYDTPYVAEADIPVYRKIFEDIFNSLKAAETQS